MLQGGPILKPSAGESVQEIITAIQAYNDTVTSPKWLIGPMLKMYSDEGSTSNADEVSILVSLTHNPIYTTFSATRCCAPDT
jgi:hypothetical protein